MRILVGFSPGVAPDVTARLLADRLAEAWGKPVVVENVTGAGGNIAADRVAKAPPNGYTLGMVGNGSLVFSPSMYERLSFDPLKDFAPITQVFVAANLLVVPASLPVKSLDELVALARAQPGKLAYAHAGAGTSQHLAAELLQVDAEARHPAGRLSRQHCADARPPRRARRHGVRQHRQRAAARNAKASCAPSPSPR